MGVRIGRTPRRGKRRGCWLRPSLALLGAVGLALTLSACPATDKPTPPSKSQLEADAYRKCVGTDRSSGAQARCQVHVWGQTFGEDDNRWICDRMGNWLCGPAVKP